MYHNINLIKTDRLDVYITRDNSHPYNNFYEPTSAVFLGFFLSELFFLQN